jgi:AraC-like DNA-binding protein
MQAIGTQAPILLAQRHLPQPIAFTRLRADAIAHERKPIAPPDDAFVLLVAIAPMAGTNAAAPGDTFIFDLRTSPTASFAGPYDFVRFHLPAATLDRLAEAQGLPRVSGLRTTPAQVRDPVMQGLAMSLLPVLEAPDTEAVPFVDSIALAMHAHVIRNYGDRPAKRRSRDPGLAPWQLRRVSDFAGAHRDTMPSIADLARECRLSASHFARRFTVSTGTAPYRWLMARRIERAKGLLLGGGDTLSQIALACGFADQSHFTRAFSRSEGQSPGQWRRRHCN